MTELTDIHGIGQAMAARLTAVGIADPAALAAADITLLSTVPGISSDRAVAWKNAAAEHVVAVPRQPSDATPSLAADMQGSANTTATPKPATTVKTKSGKGAKKKAAKKKKDAKPARTKDVKATKAVPETKAEKKADKKADKKKAARKAEKKKVAVKAKKKAAAKAEKKKAAKKAKKSKKS